MDACECWDSAGDLIVGHPFFGRKRSSRIFYTDLLTAGEDEACSQTCLNSRMWSKLPKELLVHIFARLPVRNILQIQSLSKSWRSIITSPQFQQAFADASPVRIALMVSDVVDGTIFLTQENKAECFRSMIARCQDVVLNTNIVATTHGLVCVIENDESQGGSIVGVRVFMMNLVTGLRRELPPPSIMTSLPTLVRMDKNVKEGGYSIVFIYTKDLTTLEVSSCEVYDSVKNIWSKDDRGVLKDVQVFNMSHGESYFYENMATFCKRTKAINVFNLHPSSVNPNYVADRNSHVHNVSGELYKLCKRGERHGVWKLMCSNKWEMVCKCPEVEGIWTCLRVIDDCVVLVFLVPHVCNYEGSGNIGGFVKVFHMPTKSWHTFPDEEYFLWNWDGFRSRDGFQYTDKIGNPFLVEVRFDAVP
jgi:hypothetical protein